MLRLLKKIIPHVCITLALFLITYVILNEYNPSFFSRDFFKITLVVFCVSTLIASGFLFANNRKE